MKSLHEICSILNSHSSELSKKYSISGLSIFGSVARGEAKDGSDVDITVNIDSAVSLLDIIDAENYISDLLGEKVDLVPARSIRSELKERISAESIPV